MRSWTSLSDPQGRSAQVEHGLLDGGAVVQREADQHAAQIAVVERVSPGHLPFEHLGHGAHPPAPEDSRGAGVESLTLLESSGAISFTQRFGSKLNAHLHHHAVLPDGAFAFLDDGEVRFVRIAAPTLEELERILERVIRRTTRMLVSRGLLEEPASEDALAHMQAESLLAGLPGPLEKQHSPSRLAVQLDGYSREAGTQVHEHDRLGLLHLCRYGLRAPFSQERLRVTDDGRVEL